MAQQVMARPYDEVAARLRAKPGKPHLVAAGETTARRAVLSTTLGRIRKGELQPFLPDEGGYFEGEVSGAKDAVGRLYPYELYLWYVPVQGGSEDTTQAR